MSMAEASEVTSKSGVSNVIFVQVKRSSKNRLKILKQISR